MALDGFIDDKYLVYEDSVTQSVEEELPTLHSNGRFQIWSDRYFVTQLQQNGHYWDFTVSDLFMNDSRQVRFRKSDNQVNWIEIFLLGNGFGFVFENSEEMYYVNLVKTDWSAGEFYLVDQFERECESLNILMDSLKPTRLVLATYDGWDGPRSYQMCRVIGSKLKLGETQKLATEYHHYSNGKLIGFKREEEKFFITTYDWITKHEQTVEVDYLPERFEFIHYDVDRFQQNEMNSIFYFEDAFIGFEDRNLRLTVKFSNGSFIVCPTIQNDRDDGMRELTSNVYNIPVQRPHSLRSSAWLLIVKMMKRKGEFYPYKAAKKFLPLNTDLRSVWFEDKSDSESSNGPSESDESSQESENSVPAKRNKLN